MAVARAFALAPLLAGTLMTARASAQQPSSISGSAAKPQSAAAVAAELDPLLAQLFALDLAPGMAVVVVRDTQTVYLKGFGHADLDPKRAVTPQTVFYIASSTKSFTGLAAALLDQQGKLDLDAPLSRYMPAAKLQSPLSADSITLRALLTHTHGIENSGPIVERTAYTGSTPPSSS